MAVEILCLAPAHCAALERLFARIAGDPTSCHFHPHPFSELEAQRICNYVGKDKYVGLRYEAEFSGYGMLRGWDEGFLVPSLGIYVAPELRGTGAARLLMQHLHLIAKLAGAQQVRLKAYRENTAAYRLYRAMGYEFAEQKEAEAQLIGVLRL